MIHWFDLRFSFLKVFTLKFLVRESKMFIFWVEFVILDLISARYFSYILYEL